MIRTPLILVASFGLLAGCATSSANSATPNNPDAGKVDYDAGQPSGGSGGSGSGSDSGTGSGTGTKPATKGVDSTSTSTPGIGPKVVKKIAASKPPKPVEPTEPADPKKPPPKRKGRVEVNGLLGESFPVGATEDKIPDIAAAGAAKTLFVVPNLDQAVALPSTLKVPFALRFTGTLNVTEAATYKLCLNSSDGSKLMLEGTVAVNNDGVHNTAVEACEIINLEPGEYALEVQSFHVSSTPSIGLLWGVGKDSTPAAIPKANLFKPADADTRVKAQK